MWFSILVVSGWSVCRNSRVIRICLCRRAICILEFLFDLAWTLSAYTFASSTISSLRRLISLRICTAPLFTASSTNLLKFAFVYPFDGAFSKAWIVLANAVFTSKNPSLASSAAEGASLPSKFLGWGENSTYLPRIGWFCLTYFL